MNVMRGIAVAVSRCRTRCFSSQTDYLLNVVEDKDTGFAKLSMCSRPVNGLNYELFYTLHSVLTDLENKKCKGLILTSEFPTVFCGGFDLLEIYQLKKERFAKFWAEFQNTWLKLYLAPYPTVAAINGHAPAGGCVLSLACDYRIMASGNYKIGLNETQVGIVAPHWVMEAAKNTVGSRQAELALTQGTLFTSAEAKQVGLVDDLASSREELFEKANTFLIQQYDISPVARSVTKRQCRDKTAGWLIQNKQLDMEMFLDIAQQPQVQQTIGNYLAKLKSKKR